MSNNPLNTPTITISERSRQDTTATTRPHQSLSRMGWVGHRTGRLGRTGERHAEQEQEEARTMLALRQPVLFSAEAQVADMLLNMSRCVFIYDSDGEQTITAEPTPDTTPQRHAIPSASIAITSVPDSNVSTSSIPATESVTGPAVRKITPEEYIELKNARKDKEAYENA